LNDGSGEFDHVVALYKACKGGYHIDDGHLVVDVEEDVDVPLDVLDDAGQQPLAKQHQLLFAFLQTVVERHQHTRREINAVFPLVHLDYIILDLLGKLA
jgi:hypothetical protein